MPSAEGPLRGWATNHGWSPNVPLVLYPWLKVSCATIVLRGQDRWIKIAENHSLSQGSGTKSPQTEGPLRGWATNHGWSPNVPLGPYPWLKVSCATIVLRGQDRWIKIAENHSLSQGSGTKSPQTEGPLRGWATNHGWSPNVPLGPYPWLKGSCATIVLRGQDRWIKIAENRSFNQG